MSWSNCSFDWRFRRPFSQAKALVSFQPGHVPPLLASLCRRDRVHPTDMAVSPSHLSSLFLGTNPHTLFLMFEKGTLALRFASAPPLDQGLFPENL